MVRLLVTGGAGFIGANLVRRLLDEPEVASIVSFDDYSTGVRRGWDDPRIHEVEGDLRDPAAVLAACEGIDGIVHLGALPSVPRSIADPRASHDVNVTGTLNVLEAARSAGVGHLVAASSSSVYGANLTLPKVESLASRPLSPYAVTKLATESYVNAYAHSFGLRTLAFRFFNVFGPLQRADHAYAAVVPRFLDAIHQGRPLVVHGDGEQSRDFTSVRTVVDVLAKAAMRRVTSRDPVNLALGGRTTLTELISIMERVVGHPLEVEHVEPRPGDVRHSQADGAALRALIPDLERPSLHDAVRETHEWFLREASPSRS